MPSAYKQVNAQSDQVKPRKIEVAGSTGSTDQHPSATRKEISVTEKNSAVYNMEAKVKASQTESSSMGNFVNTVA